MNNNPVKQIYKFNQQAGLLNNPYDDRRESAYPIEEALEGFFSRINNGIDFGMSDLSEYLSGLSPKEISRYIMNDIVMSEPISDLDRLDKHLDTIVYSFGSIFKLGLSPQQAMRALDVVATKNMEKINAGQDLQGKQLKPKGFIGPEEQLQRILQEVR